MRRKIVLEIQIGSSGEGRTRDQASIENRAEYPQPCRSRRVVQLVLGERPVGDAAVGGDGEEVEVLCGVLLAPADLPDGVRVLAGLDGAVVHRFVALLADVEDGDGAVVEADGEQGGVLRRGREG